MLYTIGIWEHTLAKALDCLRMYLATVVIHNGFRTRCLDSFVIYKVL